ncbi:MAG: exopolysaccharide Pel transporter PelG [Spirochaetales bacterium]|nr:exopolysaccharide Pel transporter PelG [Spirochaetales bacterium]
MAGIGFELRKVINKGGLGSFFQIAMSGAMIVAGPWILSIITIILIQTFLIQALDGKLELFMGVIIYCYAFSLFLFGGFHYLFTRRMSDLLYNKKEGQAFGYVLLLCIPVSLVSILLSLPSVLMLDLKIEHAALFKASTVLIFTIVNCMWIVMLFVSVLKWYMKILIVYASGLFSSLFFIYIASKHFGLAGALLGFGTGHLLIVILLIILCRAAWKPVKPEPPHDIKTSAGFHPLRNFIKYLLRHRYLFGAGLLYYWGIWIDKFIFWQSFGENLSETYIRLFSAYDIPVYLANLTMIPGLIFFVIFSETEFYTALKRFLFKLTGGRYSDILMAKRTLGRVTLTSIKEQSIMQGTITVIIIIMSENIIMQITLAAVFFHLLLLTLLNYLFYIEQYRHAFYCSAVFFCVNAITALITAASILSLSPGFSYMISAAAASGTAVFLLKRDISTLERHIFTKK